MTKEALLDSLVKKGAMVRVQGAFLPLAHAEFLPGNRLFIVSIDPAGQQDAHAIDFDTWELPWERDVLLSRESEIVAHVAEPAEFPEVNTDDVLEQFGAWRSKLQDADQAAAFQAFVAQMRGDFTR